MICTAQEVSAGQNLLNPAKPFAIYTPKLPTQLNNNNNNNNNNKLPQFQNAVTLHTCSIAMQFLTEEAHAHDEEADKP
jgi:hypothetical protein